ncbi:MAG: T9SS type A sorting domain-containing protein, partial [Draconibacterium sp.]|nr:T9SS type A sorting domain-containing protein [Draconibacterium sp.]
SVTAQTVISANGGTETAAGTQVSWTIGEPITATISDGTTTLTQGFHQSNLTVTAINNIQIAGVEIKVYPNPTSDFVTVHFSKVMERPTYFLFDLLGGIIEQKNIESTDVKIDMTRFAEGSYILKLSSGQKPLQSFKIIKR